MTAANAPPTNAAATPAKYTPPSPSSSSSSSSTNSPAMSVTTLADLLGEQLGMKRKRESTHFDGIPVAAILAERPAKNEPRAVCSPRRRSLIGAVATESTKGAEANDEGSGETEAVMESRGEDDEDDEDDITVII